jgi:hypothetical protein
MSAIVWIVVVIIVILLVFWFVWSRFPTIDCTKFGLKQGLGCASNRDYWGGICYTDTWKASNGTKTEVCTVTYSDCPPDGCTHFVGTSSAENGTECSSKIIPGWNDNHFGPGWYLTGTPGTKYCHRGGTYAVYCENPTIPDTCPNDLEKYAGACYGKCPTGYNHSSLCTCSKQ